MKIKSRPEDFIVEEFLTLPEFAPAGDYVIYKLEKKGLSTLDVVNRLVRTYGVPDKKISFAGMKDKYAFTSQYLSVKSGEAKEIKERNFTLTPLGRAVRPIGSDLLGGNRFKITLRNLEKVRIEEIVNSLNEVSEYGFPNYFGEQRFGSVRHGGGFLAKRLVLGDFEGALRLYLSRWSSRDRPIMKEFKKFVSRNWGDWEKCLKVAPRSNERVILSYLKGHPKDFLKAINLINSRMLFLYVAAYQSYLWNETASEFIKTNLKKGELTEFRYVAGEMVFYKTLPKKLLEEFIQTRIPLVDHKVEFSDGRIKGIAERVIKREGVRVENFKLNKIKGAFFKSVQRELVVFPGELEIAQPTPDEIYPHRFKLTTSFFLPSGSYASVLLRRVGPEGERSGFAFG